MDGGMKVRQTLAEAQKCFGQNVANHSILIITKSNPYTPQNAKTALEHECRVLGLRYIYFNTSYDQHTVPENERN